MSWLPVLVGVLLVMACGASGALVLLYRAQGIRRREAERGLSTPYLRLAATLVGASGGAIVGAIAAYYLSQGQRVSLTEWVGRFSYVLIAWSGTAPLLTLVRAAVLLRGEQGSRPVLGRQRREALVRLRQRYRHYVDIKARDDEVVAGLVGLLGTPVLNARRAMTRIPLYGYLGTVCGILLMVEDLSRIDEATETFRVLASMAHGLFLAFETTLVGLLVYLPLRKAADYLLEKLEAVEEEWIRLREAEEGEE
ncbi:MAG: MotA/TolQ/ExbB proton channel family protein [Candidatus Latescibacterota bacterium]